MLLRARGKERVERVSIAGLARRPTGASAKLWLSHWAKQTHTPRDRTSEATALWKKGMTKIHILVRARKHAGQSEPRFQNGH